MKLSGRRLVKTYDVVMQRHFLEIFILQLLENLWKNIGQALGVDAQDPLDVKGCECDHGVLIKVKENQKVFRDGNAMS